VYGRHHALKVDRPRGALKLILIGLTTVGSVALNIYSPALPMARAEFGVSVSQANLSISLALIAFAVGLFCSGPLSDRVGRRPAVLIGLVLYVGGALLALFAHSMTTLILARIVTALGASAGVTVARAVLGDLFDKHRMTHEIASLTLITTMVNAAAPILGGLLIQWFAWRAVFAALVISGGSIAALVFFSLPETRPAQRSRPNLRIFIALRRVLRDRQFLQYVFQGGVIYAVFFVFIALVPHILYDLHRPPTDYGLWYPMISIGYFFGNYFVTRRGASVGLERLIQWGVIGQAVAAIAGLIWMSLGFWGSFWIFLAPALMAIGQGLAMPATTALGVARAPKDAGVAAGVLGFGQQAMGALAVECMSFASTDSPIPMAVFCASLAGFAALIALKRPTQA
jgi:DHA1 family bicyclomycin/chloramphenicol resistance-like MFS transporter